MASTPAFCHAPPMSDPLWLPFFGALHYRRCDAAPAAGSLSSAHRPTAVGVDGPVLVMLSASAGFSPDGASVALDELARALAAAGRDAGQAEARAAVQDAVRQAFTDGRFGRGLPEILLVVATPTGQLQPWHAGPNALALAGKQGVRRLSEDVRYAALQRAGATREGAWPTDPLALESTGLTILEPPFAKLQQFTASMDGGGLLLVSKGALPFGASEAFAAPADWWAGDAGWCHGLGATVVAVADAAGQAVCDAALDGWRARLGSRAAPEASAHALQRSAFEHRAEWEAVALRLLGDPAPLLKARGMVMAAQLHLRALEPEISRSQSDPATFEAGGRAIPLGRLATAACRALQAYRPIPGFPDWAALAGPAPAPAPADLDDGAAFAYLAARQLLLERAPEAMGLAREGFVDLPFGVVMETGYPPGTHTFAYLADGQIEDHLSTGVLETAQADDADLQAAGAALLAEGAAAWAAAAPIERCARPQVDAVQFLLLGATEVRATPPTHYEALAAEHPLTPLYLAAHALLGEVNARAQGAPPAPALTFSSAHALVETLAHFRGWFEHVGDALRAAAPGFDPDEGRALLHQLAAAGVGYALGCQAEPLTFRDAAHRAEVEPILQTMATHLRDGFAAGRVASVDQPQLHPLWILCGLPHPEPLSELDAALAAGAHAQYVDLHDRDDLGPFVFGQLGRLTPVVVLDLAATGARVGWLDRISFADLPHLRALDLAENPLDALPVGLQDARALEYLSLRRTRVAEVPDLLFTLPALRCVDLRATPIASEAIARLRRARPALHVLA